MMSHLEPVIRLPVLVPVVKSSQEVGLRDSTRVFHPYCRHPSDGGAHTDRIRTVLLLLLPGCVCYRVRCLAEKIRLSTALIMPIYGIQNITPPVLAQKKNCVYIYAKKFFCVYAYCVLVYTADQHLNCWLRHIEQPPEVWEIIVR